MENSQVEIIEAMLQKFVDEFRFSEEYRKASDENLSASELVMNAGQVVHLLYKFERMQAAIEQILEL